MHWRGSCRRRCELEGTTRRGGSVAIHGDLQRVDGQLWTRSAAPARPSWKGTKRARDLSWWRGGRETRLAARRRGGGVGPCQRAGGPWESVRDRASDEPSARRPAAAAQITTPATRARDWQTQHGGASARRHRRRPQAQAASIHSSIPPRRRAMQATGEPCGRRLRDCTTQASSCGAVQGAQHQNAEKNVWAPVPCLAWGARPRQAPSPPAATANPFRNEA